MKSHADDYCFFQSSHPAHTNAGFMAPLIILVRHAEALHNALLDYNIRDPPLTERGLRQCEELQERLQNSLGVAQKIELIVSSPMRRALQTAQLGMGWLLDRGVPIQPRAEWQGQKNPFTFLSMFPFSWMMGS